MRCVFVLKENQTALEEQAPGGFFLPIPARPGLPPSGNPCRAVTGFFVTVYYQGSACIAIVTGTNVVICHAYLSGG
jgi:hypothetical protein